MKLSGHEFLNILNSYFSRQDFGGYTFWLLLIPFVFFLIWLIIYFNPFKSNRNPFDDIPDEEMEMIKQISVQKGLSSFDRDFLVMQALNYNIKPTSILLDISTFDRILKRLEEKAKISGVIPELDENYKNMKNLRYRVF